MAIACVEHCKWMQKKKRGLKALPSVADLLNGIFVHQLTYGTLEELLATITNLREALKSLPKVNFGSIAFIRIFYLMFFCRYDSSSLTVSANHFFFIVMIYKNAHL
jgi:hypothetical protein